jgi:hypothetical protein
MYYPHSGLILGFHGCELSIRNKIITDSNSQLHHSNNNYDWLGHGIYFWENNPQRALQFAKERFKREKDTVSKPAVVGAVIDLGKCLDLLDSGNLSLVKQAYKDFCELMELAGKPLPKNIGITNDKLMRQLDCAVIQYLMDGNNTFDSVRGLFPEGSELYPGAGFREKDHIQICIRNPNCIKGYFVPRKENSAHKTV